MSFPELITDKLEPIGLEDMNGVKLLDRRDRKYTFHISQLPDILLKAREHYKILTIDGKRFAHYETRYFDTPDYEMYTKHHNSQLNRNKVRFRTYLDSDLHFFEVKYKNNKGRTIKKRVVRPVKDYSITTDAEKLLTNRTPYGNSELKEAIKVFYNRITLVSKNLKERITIDFELNYELEGRKTGFPNMIIAEVKQDRTDHSHFIDLMKEKRIKDISISKYCLGIASLAPNVKKNNFKIKLHYVEKLCNTPA